MGNFVIKKIQGISGLVIMLFLFMSCTLQNPAKPRILIITGGHDFETAEFLNVFNVLTEFSFDTVSQPSANQMIGSGKALIYNAIVFYDSWQEINVTEKKAYLELTERGTGLLFLHHSLVSYQSWDEFSLIRGGRYPKSDTPDSLKDGRYRHDIDLSVTIVDTSTSITKGLSDFTIRDEGYSNIIVNDDVTVLLKTIHPDCAEDIGWTHQYKNSKIVYLMSGHDHVAYENENFRKLVRNSLEYLTMKE